MPDSRSIVRRSFKGSMRIISRPWFPAKKDGRVVEDLDISLRNLTGDWLRRIEECVAGVNGSGPKASKFQSYSSLDKLSTFVTGFFEKYPVATEQLLAHEHKSYFLNIAQRSGQKPAPFVRFWIATLRSSSRRYSLCV